MGDNVPYLLRAKHLLLVYMVNYSFSLYCLALLNNCCKFLIEVCN